MFDRAKAKTFNCTDCPVNLQRLRNCSGNGSPAKNELNDALYSRCPRAIHLEAYEERALVTIYAECRENKIYPAPGGPLDQTQFTLELFDYVDSLVNANREKMSKPSNP